MCHYEIPKRYSEFREFRKNLKDYFPDMKLTKFPQKNYFNKMSQKVIDKRLIMLNQFLQGLVTVYQQKNILILLKFLELRGNQKKKENEKASF